MVAKSYQSFPQIGTHYERDGKEYIKVRKPDGTIKEVRWYYDPVTLDSLKKARFDGRDTIFISKNISMDEGVNINLCETGARYRCGIGWYWFEQPKDIPTVPYAWTEELARIATEPAFAHLING